MMNMVAPSCSGSEFDGSVGSATSAADCLARVQAGAARVNYAVWRGDSNNGCFVCDLTDRGDSSTWKLTSTPGAACFIGPPVPPPGVGYFTANLTVTAGDDKNEVVYGLGQGGWTPEGGCPAGGAAGAAIVPLERNGQSVNLQQRKFHVSIPFIHSTAGYGFLFNMPGYGEVITMTTVVIMSHTIIAYISHAHSWVGPRGRTWHRRGSVVGTCCFVPRFLGEWAASEGCRPRLDAGVPAVRGCDRARPSAARGCNGVLAVAKSVQEQ